MILSNRVIFLGTAGARFTVFKQIRASGGMWLELENTNILVDPGPGALIRCLRSKAKLDPKKLDAIIVTHRHLDHCADVNVMIEAMTEGGSKPKGKVFLPKDAIEEDPVVLKYLQNYVLGIEILMPNKTYTIKGVKFIPPIPHIHGVETYGLNFYVNNKCISYITDTKFFPTLPTYYPGEVVILNVVLLHPNKDKEIMHLSLEDAKKIITKLKPKLSILTHFGMTMIKAKPWKLAEELTKELGVKVISANDGMKLEV
jgi:phosphoribosyl 1,2-cyclic phosphodiesterase